MDPYHEYEALRSFTPKQRVEAFRESVIKMLSDGDETIESMRGIIKIFEDQGMYEGAQGILEAINKFEEKSGEK